MKKFLDIFTLLVFLIISLAVLTEMYGYKTMIKPIDYLIENYVKSFWVVWLTPPIFYLIFKIKKNNRQKKQTR